MENFNIVIFSLLGGVSLFLYGLHLIGQGIQIVGANKLRPILLIVTQNRTKGFITGILLAAGLQSSTATSLTLIGFASAELLTLNQTIPLILGANIGTTFTVQLLAFNVLEYALLFVSAGSVLFFFAKSNKGRFIGSLILGFGFIFLGLKIITDGVAPVKSSEFLSSALVNTGNMQGWVITFSSLFAALLHSSAATIGIAMALAANGIITIKTAISIVIGANLGSCAIVLISSLGKNAQAKRVAVSHISFKIIGVLVLLFFLEPFTWAVTKSSLAVARQIANAHTIFNISLAIAFLPISHYAANLTALLIPDSPQSKAAFSPKFLDYNVLDSPPLALGQATRELLRMGDIVQQMFSDTIKVFTTDDISLAEEIESRDDMVDCLDRGLKLYITKISEKELTEEFSSKQVELLSIANDLENIGDIIDKNLMEIAKKKIYKGLRFSTMGQKEIIELHKMVMSNFRLVINGYATQNMNLADKMLKTGKVEVKKKEQELKQAHIKRLQSGLKESIETSAIHMDVLTNLKRINSHLVSIAVTIIT